MFQALGLDLRAPKVDLEVKVEIIGGCVHLWFPPLQSWGGKKQNPPYDTQQILLWTDLNHTPSMSTQQYSGSGFQFSDVTNLYHANRKSVRVLGVRARLGFPQTQGVCTTHPACQHKEGQESGRFVPRKHKIKQKIVNCLLLGFGTSGYWK